MNNITGNILKYFEEITKIPRPTKGEGKVAEHIVNWAKSNMFEAEIDSVGNVLVKTPASKGRENDPIITIQGHMDMVCEKTPDSKIDPNVDSLKLIYEGDWLKADKTTLGADNGIAIALAMQAVTDKEISRPAMELLFTVCEEDGFDGVLGLKANSLKGKYLINLDSSQYGVFTIACSSGQTAKATYNMKKDTNIPDTFQCFDITLDGALGGHSGLDINKKRCNAIIALAFSLNEILENMPLYIISFNGGTKKNVIPRKSFVSLAIPKENEDLLYKILSKCEKYITDKYTEDCNVKLNVKKSVYLKSISLNDSKKLIDILINIPNGVESWSKELDNSIEASNNIAVATLDDNYFEVLSFQRGASVEGLSRVTAKVENAFKVYNASKIDIQKNVSVPWKEDSNSSLLIKAKSVFKNIFGVYPQIVATHGGLECACIKEKHPEMEVVSFGPSIENLHSPDERLNIRTLEPTYKILTGILEK